MQEKLSAMMDGEWDEHEMAQLMASLDDDETNAQCWRDYHLIGDALNQRCVLSDQFLDNFSSRFADEPVILAPNAMRHRKSRLPAKRWVALSVAASVALVSATAWYVGGAQALSQPGQTELQVAANQLIKPQADEANPYLLAHQAMLGNPGFSHRPVILTGAEAERVNAHR